MAKIMTKVRAAVRKKLARSPKVGAVKKTVKKATRTKPPPDSARVDFAKLTLRDALDLAVLAEEEAQERYEKLATMVGGRYAGDAGDVFRSMAELESLHGSQLRERRERLFKKAKRTISRDALYDIEAPDFTKVNVFMSARQAMEVAIEDEAKAYDFYDRALPYVKDADVKKLFEELRGDEKKHHALLRKKIKGLPSGPDIEAEYADEPGSDPG